MTWQSALLTAAMGLAGMIAGGWFNKPKVRGEGRKAEGEGEEAASSAVKLLTEAQIARQIDALASAEATTKEAKQACADCNRELMRYKLRDRQHERAFDAIHDALLEIVPLLEADSESTKMLRVCIRTVRQARYEE